MSNATFPQRLTKIDDLTRPDHHYLGADDECFYFGDYTARAGFTGGPTNDLIFNFKKPVDRRGRPEWRYKERAMTSVANAFTSALDPAFMAAATLVPIPPSKAKSDARYDDRLLVTLRQFRQPNPPDVRELLRQTQTREAAAHDGERPGPDELAALYAIDQALCMPAPRSIAVFDDVLVTGASFVAAKRVLAQQFPVSKIYGLFIARRALPDIADVFDAIDLP